MVYKPKEPESLDTARVLGLQMGKNTEGRTTWRRGNVFPDIEDRVTRRGLFSICGQLIGHYPVAGWLRIACGFIKRSSSGSDWSDYIGDKAQQMLNELLEDVRKKDPVGGEWSVSREGGFGKVWCDASSLATGCVLEIDDVVVEDAAWLRP